LYGLVIIAVLLVNQYGWSEIINDPGLKNVAVSTSRNNMLFVENLGQIRDNRVRFYAQAASGLRLYVTSDGQIIYATPPLPDTQTSSLLSVRPISEIRQRRHPAGPGKSYHFTETFLGSLPIGVSGGEKAEGKANYFTGNDPKQWKRDLSFYKSVSLGDIYPNIEAKVVYKGDNFEKVFTVKPQGRVSDIQIKIGGASHTSIGEKGELNVETLGGTLSLTRPVAYQEIAGKKVEVAVAYSFSSGSNIYGFTIGTYEKGAPLFIDPVVELTTCFGGSNQREAAYGLTLDNYGNIFVTGFTYSLDFPTVNPIQQKTSEATESDVFVMKISSTGDRIIYSTYLIGLGNDGGASIAVDDEGNAYVTGRATSGFPIKNGLPITPGTGVDYCFVAKINPGGNDLVFSTFLGAPSEGFDKGTYPTTIASVTTLFAKTPWKRKLGGGMAARISRSSIPRAIG
jgi:hypothetical protein